jgi:hypothetical protein
MNLSDFGIGGGTRKTLVILGAGASRGASFVEDEVGVVPPLDLDFFQQVARLEETDESKRLLEFIREEYGHEIGLSMEKFFSESDYTDRFHKNLNVDPGPIVKKYQKALDAFFVVLPKLIEETTSEECDYHRVLADNLHARDSVITFNYDCLMDKSLRDHAGNRWKPDDGSYGFEVADGAENWMDHTRGQPVKNPIKLLKMHGSQNWMRGEEDEIELREATDLSSNLKDVIIPPTWSKDLAEFPFGEIWKDARVEVRRARIIVVVGYSVPDTDLFSKSLFKVEAGSKKKREKLDLLVLVNPDKAARKSFIDLVSGGIEPTTTILEYNTMNEIAHLIDRNSS